jgi:hypothetical protein
MRTQARHILKACNGVQYGSCSPESTQIQRQRLRPHCPCRRRLVNSNSYLLEYCTIFTLWHSTVYLGVLRAIVIQMQSAYPLRSFRSKDLQSMKTRLAISNVLLNMRIDTPKDTISIPNAMGNPDFKPKLMISTTRNQ